MNMLKYVKYIFLVILIVVIVHVSIMYINYSKDNENFVNNKDDNTYNLLDNVWYFSKIVVYNDGNLVNETIVNSDSYIYLNDGRIDYCASSGEECINNKYVYGNDKLIVYIDYLFAKGEYIVGIKDNVLELSKNDDKITTIYVFETYLG